MFLKIKNMVFLKDNFGCFHLLTIMINYFLKHYPNKNFNFIYHFHNNLNRFKKMFPLILYYILKIN